MGKTAVGDVKIVSMETAVKIKTAANVHLDGLALSAIRVSSTLSYIRYVECLSHLLFASHTLGSLLLSFQNALKRFVFTCAI